MLNSAYATNLFKVIFAQSNKVELTGTGLCYLGMSTTVPNTDGSNFTEPEIGDATGYERVLINANDAMEYTNLMIAPEVDPETGKVYILNDKEIVLPEAKTDWGTFTHFGIFGAATGGDPILFHELTEDTPGENGEYPATTITVSTGDVILFRKQQLKAFL